MIKRNNKGFTLLELLISIFILTTVVFLGYRVINKSTMDIKNQGNINKGQLTVNDMNEYLTKDLEQARSIALLLDNKEIANTKEVEDNTQQQDILKEKVTDLEKKLSEGNNFSYSYKIKFEEDENIEVDKSDENSKYNVIYQVNFTKKDENNYKYTIKRTDVTDGVSITFVNDEKFTIKDNENIELPFIIEGNSPYKVLLGYNGKNNEFKKHEFTVTSRLNNFDNGGNENTENDDSEPPIDTIPPNTEEVPEIPSDVDKEQFQSIGYWMMDTKYYDSTNHKGDLYTWIQDKNGRAENYGKQGTNTEKFYISGTNSANSGQANSGDTHAYMKDSKESAIYLTNVSKKSLQADDVNKIKIYVSAHTTVKQTKVEITSKSKEFIGIKDEEGKYLSQDNGSYTLEGGDKGKWYDIEIKKKEVNGNGNGSDKINFIIDGILSIDKKQVKSGYAMIVYGDAANGGSTSGNNNLDGDIVFEYISNDKYNSNMTQLTSSIKVQEKYVEYKSVYDNTSDNDKNQFLTQNIIKLMIENNSEMDKVNGKYIKNQTEDTSNLIRVTNSPYGNPVITNNKICKDIRDVNEILIMFDENTKLLEATGNCIVSQISSNKYKLTMTQKQPNINLKFNFNQIGEIGKFKITFTLIEG